MTDGETLTLKTVTWGQTMVDSYFQMLKINCHYLGAGAVCVRVCMACSWIHTYLGFPSLTLLSVSVTHANVGRYQGHIFQGRFRIIDSSYLFFSNLCQQLSSLVYYFHMQSRQTASAEWRRQSGESVGNHDSISVWRDALLCTEDSSGVIYFPVLHCGCHSAAFNDQGGLCEILSISSGILWRHSVFAC